MAHPSNPIYAVDSYGDTIIDFVAGPIPGQEWDPPLVDDEEVNDEVTEEVEEEVHPQPGVVIEPSFIKAIPEEYVRLADQKTLTKSILSKMDYTDLVRLAAYPPAADIIYECMAIRGLPLRWGTGDSAQVLSVPRRLQDHQIETLKWMRAKEAQNPKVYYGIRGGIVSLTMGLGKTLIALALILTAPKGVFPSLVIVSKMVMLEWRSQTKKFFGGALKILYLHKDFIGDNMLTITRKHLQTFDIVITTYDVCSRACKQGEYSERSLERGDEHSIHKDKIIEVHLCTREEANLPKLTGPDIIYGTPWERVICDESQRYANPSTKTFRYIMAIYGTYKWCLTATPIKNYCTDIWAQLRFCGYNGVAQVTHWKRQAHVIYEQHKLALHTISMGNSEAGIELPPKKEVDVYVTLEGRQREAYDYILGATRKAFDLMMQKACSFACVLALFTRLRQCAISPYLITAESKREKQTKKAKEADLKALEYLKKTSEAQGGLGKWCHDPNGEAGIHSSKLRELISILAGLSSGEKIIGYSNFTSCLDLVAKAITASLPTLDFMQLDGDTKTEEREIILDRFRGNPKAQLLLMTLKVGSEGLNLTQATRCIFIEPWWNSAVLNQAKARCWRTGQTRPVTIYHLLAKDTIEERMIEICKEKEEMTASFLSGSTHNINRGVGLTKVALGRILGIYR